VRAGAAVRVGRGNQTMYAVRRGNDLSAQEPSERHGEPRR
jgi:hypothetical protein